MVLHSLWQQHGIILAQSEDCTLSSGMEDGICSLPKERALVLFCKVPSSYSGHFQPSDEIDCGHPS